MPAYNDTALPSLPEGYTDDDIPLSSDAMVTGADDEKNASATQEPAVQYVSAGTQTDLVTITASGPPSTTPAQDATLNTIELLEAILAFLPLEDLYRARSVRKKWRRLMYGTKRREGKDGSPTLQRLLFWRPSIKPLQRVHYSGFWTTPLVLNPLLNRVIIIPVHGNGYLAVLAALGSSGLAANTERTPLYENLLHADSPAEDSKDGKDGNSSRPAVLTDHKERPIADRDISGGVIPPRERKPVDSNKSQWAWKTMHISDTPILAIKIKRVGNFPAVAYNGQGPGLQLGHLLHALEDLETQFPEKWPKAGEAPDGVHEFEIQLPLFTEGGKQAMTADGMGIWRAVKTRLRCRIEFVGLSGSDGDDEAGLTSWGFDDTTG